MSFSKYFLFIAVFSVIILSGCSAAISKEQAEAKAVLFVNSNVKFFAKSQDETTNLSAYKVDSTDSYKENNEWVVVMHVSSELGNETKKNDLTIRIDSTGEVSEFNGQKVPK